MIKSDSQLRRTKEQIANFKTAIERAIASPKSSGMSAEISVAYVDGLRGQLAQLEAEVERYRRLKDGDVTIVKIKSLDDLPLALLEIRIARRKSQSDIARGLGVAPQQVQRWEADEYQSASFPMLCEIARILGVSLADGITIEPHAHTGEIAV